ncbi:hypothetical protein [Amycolatopsis sacchari]|uniref:hypothetical protein n=1 Tax=Amycolatopsis sacchari TaxID=115433 RepID=UPI003D722B73
MTAGGPELTQVVLAALREVPGLRPATPITRSWLPWDADAMAVDLDDELVEVRVVVLTLPLRPVLHHATTVLRAAVRKSRWATAQIRLVVADIDAVAFETLDTGNLNHTIGS